MAWADMAQEEASGEASRNPREAPERALAIARPALPPAAELVAAAEAAVECGDCWT